MANSIFLCHSSEDKPFARRLATDLKARGLRVWIDEGELNLGDSLIGRIESAIDDVDYLAVLLSPHSVKSEWCVREVRMALHREISGKRVVVLPLLIEHCKIPGFLRDKLYADFRYESNYTPAIDSIVKRLGHDLFSDPDTQEAFSSLEKMPFTRLWKTAVEVNSYSDDLKDLFERLLAEMSMTQWSPGIAMSYLWFLKEIVELAAFNIDLCDLLRRIVDNRNTKVWLRISTLDAMLKLVSRRKPGIVVSPPRLFNDDGSANDTELLRELIGSYWDLARAHSTAKKDTGQPVRILANLWCVADQPYRRCLIRALSRYATSPADDELRPLADNVHNDSVDDITRILNDVRDRHIVSGESESLTAVNNRVAITLHRLLNEKNAFVDTDEVVEVFRKVSELEENGEFTAYVLASDILGKEPIHAIRETQGAEFTFRCFVTLTIDPFIDPALSFFALLALGEEFGWEALLLNDRLPQGLFEKRQRKRDADSLIECMCNMVANEEAGNTAFAAAIIANIYSGIGDKYKKRILKLVKRISLQSRVADSLLNCIEGKLSPDEFREVLAGVDQTEQDRFFEEMQKTGRRGEDVPG